MNGVMTRMLVSLMDYLTDCTRKGAIPVCQTKMTRRFACTL